MDLILQQIPQQLVNGITIGGVYALIALGYTMVYGILFMLNFAHGEVYMIGGFTGWWVLHLLTRGQGPLVGGFVIIVLMIVGAMALTGLLGITIERFAYRPLRNAPRMNLLLSALGVSIVLQNLVLRFQSAKIRFFHTSALIPEGIRTIEIGGTIISFMRLLVIVVSLALMFVLTWFVKNTKMGKAMRATAQDAEAATFMGIDTNRIIMLTFLI
jgi:branched-chain amino acid transport system permease protein